MTHGPGVELGFSHRETHLQDVSMHSVYTVTSIDGVVPRDCSSLLPAVQKTYVYRVGGIKLRESTCTNESKMWNVIVSYGASF